MNTRLIERPQALVACATAMTSASAPLTTAYIHIGRFLQTRWTSGRTTERSDDRQQVDGHEHPFADRQQRQTHAPPPQPPEHNPLPCPGQQQSQHFQSPVQGPGSQCSVQQLPASDGAHEDVFQWRRLQDQHKHPLQVPEHSGLGPHGPEL
jgi:hypothetical protein